jgi:hypothetical protein
MILTKSTTEKLDQFANLWQSRHFDSLQEILDLLIEIEDELKEDIDRDYVVIDPDGSL